jgi:hypothetical protein
MAAPAAVNHTQQPINSEGGGAMTACAAVNHTQQPINSEGEGQWVPLRLSITHNNQSAVKGEAMAAPAAVNHTQQRIRSEAIRGRGNIHPCYCQSHTVTNQQ